VAYFTATVARSNRGWRSRAVDVEDCQDLDELADRLRAEAISDEPVLLLLEREDDWFAVVRVDGAEDPRVFVSDVAAATTTRVGRMLGAESAEEDSAGSGPQGGDLDLLDDLGTPAEALRELCGPDGPLPGDALLAISEAAGCAELVDAMR
jgi:putative tRNA adenosine deaminase-associated protein